MIRAANEPDLPDISKALPEIIEVMRAAGNDQWGPLYPTMEHFSGDLKESTLFVEEEGGQIRGFAVLNFEEPEQYFSLPWTVPKPALVVHRLAVVPAFRRLGVADRLFAFAEQRAGDLRTAGLRSDTYSRNPAMSTLFAKRGWRKVGTLSFPGREAEFFAWEKSVN